MLWQGISYSPEDAKRMLLYAHGNDKSVANQTFQVLKTRKVFAYRHVSHLTLGERLPELKNTSLTLYAKS